MKKATNKEYGLTLVIVVLCIFFFVAGVSIPLIFNRNVKTSDATEDEKFNAIYDVLTKEWYFGDSVENLDQTLLEQAIEGMTTLEQDPHTQYFDLESAKAFSESLEGSNVGLGMSYFQDADNNLVIKDIYLDSPVEKAGLQKGDVITKVGDLVCSENDSETIVDKIKSSKGKELAVTYLRNDQENTVSITPTDYDETVVCYIDKDKGYGEIILSSFSEKSGEDFAKAMKRLEEAGIKRLILDLRDNTGGYLSAAVDIASSLLPQDSVIFQEETKDGSRTEQTTSKDYQQVKMDKIVILQNDTTASASEALIGALRDNLGDSVVTVGTTSYGKGTEQTSIPFSDGTSLKYTIAKWYTPDGNSIHEVGFTPDIEVAPESISEVSYSTDETENTIEPDTVNTNAQAIQVFLQYLGYPVDRTDTYFSTTSSEALKLFQKDHSLSISGKCDPNTWKVLLKEAQLKYNENTLYSDVQKDEAIEQIEA